MPRLAVTYGVLRRLGFAEDKVEQCLRAISGAALEEAYEWVSLINCSQPPVSTFLVALCPLF